MATDTVPTSFEDSPSLAEWNTLSEEDKVKQQEEMTKHLNDPATLAKFKEACQNIGQTAVSIDNDFRVVQKGFAELVQKYGKDFPDVGQLYAPKWDGFMAVSDFSLRYCPETNLLHTSVGTENQGSSGLQGILRRRLRLH
ncbi:hypothetical protein AGABI2DRAFT_123551 [Agaricus bisporus var. bisporus H97]|uniref:hypothetical protein n=1 Tax=Agaricus bisporus var. bisporus (strain H97 / ATCC MYA-4626 / FGSC 10389) TaxID=936046 RepID=UPI00029F5576|nr:hypothetical protein AGABI2DRAFT_123551 [Agaricus bisporus var. bisporus H97]EKV41600.1 hypothetical protein AGABI2DRAFT_123551 [Agaricus bisporus var. bisporus H97]